MSAGCGCEGVRAEEGAFGSGDFEGEGLGTFSASDFRLRMDEVLHGLLSLDPGAAAARPTGADAEYHANAEAFGFADGVDEVFAPFEAEKIHFAAVDADVDFEEKDVGDTGLFHGFEVFGHAFFGEIAVHEIPIDAGFCGEGRRGEADFERVRGGGCGGGSGQCGERTGYGEYRGVVPEVA